MYRVYKVYMLYIYRLKYIFRVKCRSLASVLLLMFLAAPYNIALKSTLTDHSLKTTTTQKN